MKVQVAINDKIGIGMIDIGQFDDAQTASRRLREIGFYTDLSDASITQLIRPRYTVEATI